MGRDDRHAACRGGRGRAARLAWAGLAHTRRRRTPAMSPGPIRLDDLAAPVFSPEARQIIDAIAAFPVALDSEAVLAAASAQTGLTDFGNPDFRERLDLITACMREASSSSTRRWLFGSLPTLTMSCVTVSRRVSWSD